MKTIAKLLFALAIIFAFGLQPLVYAQGTAFTYQGRLNNGANPANGSYDLTLALFGVNSGGSAIAGPLTNSAVGVTNGLFATTLDFGANFPGTDRWLEIGVRSNATGGFTTLGPRQKLTATPYAITSSNLTGNVAASQLTGTVPLAHLPPGLVTNGATSVSISGTFAGDGSGLTNLPLANTWKTTGNVGTAPPANFIGTVDNAPLELRANNQRGLRLESTTDGVYQYMNVIGGSSINYVRSVGGTVAGGGLSSAPNGISSNSPLSTIGGGYNNLIDMNSPWSVIAGGKYNYISASSQGATIGGGLDNTISSTAFHSVVAGGAINTVSSDDATVSGGNQNTIPANATSSTISGGYSNNAAGYFSSVAGGRENSALGYTSFAAGRQAHANHDGAFVWADSVGADFASTGINQFNVRAGGGARFETGGAGMTVDGNSVALRSGSNTFSGNQNFTGVGAIITLDNKVDIYAKNTSGQAEGLLTGRWSDNATYLTYGSGGLYIRNNGSIPTMQMTPGGNVGIGVYPGDKLHVAGGITCTALTQTSDRNAKENFAPVSPQEVLNKVAALPVTTWNFKGMEDGRHMGPMAQDFYAAFGLGRGDTTITGMDPDGVALAAIQGLNQKLEQRLEQEELEITELKQNLAELSAVVKQLVAQQQGDSK